MKKMIIVILIIFVSSNVFGTSQLTDLLIYKKDTFSIDAFPLKHFLNEHYKISEDFESNNCITTACRRGYQGIWKIEGDKLYLTEILDCCYSKFYRISDDVIDNLKNEFSSNELENIKLLKDKNYRENRFLDLLKKAIGEDNFEHKKDIVLKETLRPRSKIDLKKYFSNFDEDGKVYASWYTGELNILKGIHSEKTIYLNKEDTIILTFKKGKLIDKRLGKEK